MIIYFADRRMNVLGQASTSLPKGYVITEDLKTEEIETGIATFSCRIGYSPENRLDLERMTNAGNYLLRSHDNENEFYTILESEIDTRSQTIYVYAEDAGLDLLNEIVGEYESPVSAPAISYINMYITDSGFEIGINEIPSDTMRKLKWEGEASVTSRLASIAEQFGGYEISYSFAIKGLVITNKYVNIHKERGKDEGVQLRLNREIDRIVTTKSVANLATAFVCEGGVPDGEENPITFSSEHYTYRDAETDYDFFVDGDKLKSKKANAKWSRYIWNKEPNKLADGEGYIVKPYSYDTTDPDTLRAHAMTELKKVCDMEVNYEIDIKRLPEGVKIGDRVNIIDDDGEMYVSTRVLLLETSVVDQKYSATLGEHLIRTSGISQKVIDLADQFAKTSQSATRALSVANAAHSVANTAKEGADVAYAIATASKDSSEQSFVGATVAKDTATIAQAQAQQAIDAVAGVLAKVEEIETTVENAKTAADNAEAAAEIAETKAEEAKTAATNAATDAGEAKTAASEAKTSAESAISTAAVATSTANEAIETAENASETAQAAKADAEQAEKDIAALSGNLETLSTTMETNYTRKTELTETEARLQSQITQNAGQISSTVSLVATIDETANDAKEKAEAAQTIANSAQTQANQATADAKAAQEAADAAATAAANAQSEADTAKAAAEAAQSVADKAETDLANAKADLETVTSRVDATEEEIAAAQEAVETAQAAAENAKAEATTAAQNAAEAQATATTATTNATNAKAAADDAVSKATLAQQVANGAAGDASAAQARADEAKSVALEAQSAANNAAEESAIAYSWASEAANEAALAVQMAEEAGEKLTQAQADLNTAKQNLAAVTSRVDATEDEVEAAQAAVEQAQAAADDAALQAEQASDFASEAIINASMAAENAGEAWNAAAEAQSAAEEAQAAAEQAQADVDALAVRVTSAETNITQNSEQIALMAKKTEVVDMLSGYSTKEETEAAIQVKADAITSSVSSTYATKNEVADITIGGRNLILNSGAEKSFVNTVAMYYLSAYGEDHIQNSTVSISFDACTDEPGTGIDFYMRYVKEDGSGVAVGSTIIPSLTDTYTRYSATIKVGAYPISQLGIRTGRYSNAANKSTTATVNVKNVMIDFSTKLSDWVPAPEDVSSDIQSAQESANDALTSIATAESAIQQLANSIATLVTDKNGTSLMTQTNSGWTFSLAEIEETLSSATKNIDSLAGDMTATENAVKKLGRAIDDLGVLANYIKITTSGDQPCIELGESENNFKVRITNTEIHFADGTVIPTRITRQMMIIGKAMVKDELQFGDDEDDTMPGVWIWKRRSNGNLGLMWKEVSS